MDRKMSWNVENITCLMKLSPSQNANVENNISLNTLENTLNAGDININSGIFQGGFSFSYFVLLYSDTP